MNIVNIIDNKRVAIETGLINYPSKPPYNPGKIYKELAKFGFSETDSSNKVYEHGRRLFKKLGLDEKNFGKQSWNPLGTFIKPGCKVVIKPNAVLDINQKQGESVFASITHGSVIRFVIDYVLIALRGSGEIVIADAPLAHSDFNNWKRITGVEKIVEYVKEKTGVVINIVDLRKLYSPFDYKNNYAPSKKRTRASRDPRGYIKIDLKKSSCFNEWGEKDFRRFYGSDYDTAQTVKNHLNGSHRYYVSKTILDADVLISVPKLKVHKKVGSTLNIKGMVGTQGDKNYIPHYRIGSPRDGGDEYPDFGVFQTMLNKYRMFLITKILSKKNIIFDQIYKGMVLFLFVFQRIRNFVGKILYKDKFKENILGGSWYGNDTAWRMSLDLIKIVLYCDKYGKINNKQQRQFFSIVDGIVSGEGDGPLAPSSRNDGVLVGGFNPLMVDITATRLMGFNINKIKMYTEGLKRKWLNNKRQEIDVISESKKERGMFESNDRLLNFDPPAGWKNYVEKF